MPNNDAQKITAQPQGSRLSHWLRIAAVGRNPKRTLKRISVLVGASILIFKFILLPVRIDGISMSPTYKDHAIDFVNRLAYFIHQPKRGDVVGIRAGGTNYIYRTPGVMYMKRILGLPGETVRFSLGHVLINGKPLAEPYEKGPCDWNSVPVRVGTNQYFVVGDNRSMPEEYHYHGRVEKQQIVGRVLY